MTNAELLAEIERLEKAAAADLDVALFLGRNKFTILSALRGVEAAREVVVVAKKILAKLDHPTATVTQWDADALRAALSQEEKVPL